MLDLIAADAVSLPVLLASALVAGLARGFSGFGAALIFVPLASAAAEPAVAAPLLLIVDSVLAITLLPNAWSLSERRDVAIMSLGALAGVPFGTFVLATGDPLAIRWAIAALIFALLALLLSGWRYRGRIAAPITIGVGGLAGFLSGAAQMGGPPVVAYWLGGATRSDVVRANIVLSLLRGLDRADRHNLRRGRAIDDGDLQTRSPDRPRLWDRSQSRLAHVRLGERGGVPPHLPRADRRRGAP